MLEKQDLQAIKELIDTSVNSAITASEERTQAKLDAMEERMTAKIDASITASEERTQAKLDAMEERLQGKIDDVEERLQAKIDDVDNHWRTYAESFIMPNFQLLAEGHQTLLETLAPKSRVDNLEDDVIFLKSIVKTLMQEVSDLKKAQ